MIRAHTLECVVNLIARLRGLEHWAGISSELRKAVDDPVLPIARSRRETNRVMRAIPGWGKADKEQEPEKGGHYIS